MTELSATLSPPPLAPHGTAYSQVIVGTRASQLSAWIAIALVVLAATLP